MLFRFNLIAECDGIRITRIRFYKGNLTCLATVLLPCGVYCKFSKTLERILIEWWLISKDIVVIVFKERDKMESK